MTSRWSSTSELPKFLGARTRQRRRILDIVNELDLLYEFYRVTAVM